jgi:hypothetical protein
VAFTTHEVMQEASLLGLMEVVLSSGEQGHVLRNTRLLREDVFPASDEQPLPSSFGVVKAHYILGLHSPPPFPGLPVDCPAAGNKDSWTAIMDLVGEASPPPTAGYSLSHYHQSSVALGAGGSSSHRSAYPG